MKMFQGSIEIYCIKTWIYSGKIKIHIIKKKNELPSLVSLIWHFYMFLVQNSNYVVTNVNDVALFKCYLLLI